MGLLKDVTVLDKMYELNLEYLEQLDLYIAAGDEILLDLQTTAAAGARGRGAARRATRSSPSSSPTSARRWRASSVASTISSSRA